MKEKCECGTISSHTVFEKGKKKRLCCACYVRAGNPPADWHTGCMREVGKTVVTKAEIEHPKKMADMLKAQGYPRVLNTTDCKSKGDIKMIPKHIKSGIDWYVDKGSCVGHFLNAVLSNDLFEVVFRADNESFFYLHEICKYVFNFTPAPCWGSKKKVEDWLKLHKENPVEAEKIASGDRSARKDYG